MSEFWIINSVPALELHIVLYIRSRNEFISNLSICILAEKVSEAITLIKYPTSEAHVLSFPTNTLVTVYSKGAGKRKNLWGVEVSLSF